MQQKLQNVIKYKKDRSIFKRLQNKSLNLYLALVYLRNRNTCMIADSIWKYS